MDVTENLWQGTRNGLAQSTYAMLLSLQGAKNSALIVQSCRGVAPCR